ncbi:hypothetical protein SCHPADRAFT_907960 [Schizopora paradoxa]|uniref:Uncharacterized protein n=1 Tax=Schizopora paradoxa TaxID=27342 RepID=A0A0H2RBI6_9AGAM|nr:hypothetical protein SCHPADRAFT_907960 [Schizopora paradoxa]
MSSSPPPPYSETAPCQCQIRAREERQVAPDPPANMKGNIAYGYKVDPTHANKIVRKVVGHRKSHLTEKTCVFWATVQSAIPLRLGSEDMHLEVRRDLDPSELRGGTSLLGYFIVLATGHSRLLPSKRRIDRLKKVLRTDAEPEWCEIW